MLTCQVGETNVDTFSFKDEKLREWSNKGMLKCPVCNEKMIYCHGDFKVPYFRHNKNCDCPDIYSEGITEEHLKGIKIIYEWLQVQDNILNLQLEKWIPETRQRPDIYFEKEENKIVKKYAIEFQCSPIATKYNERHDLYRLNNINDIWILGSEKYDINTCNIEKQIYNNTIIEEYKTKTIEREIYESNKILNYFNPKNKRIYQIKEFNNSMRTRYAYPSGNEYTVLLKTKFDIKLNSGLIEDLLLNNLTTKTEFKVNENYYNNLFNNTKNFIIDFFKKQKCVKKLKNKKKDDDILIYFSFNNKDYCVKYIYKEMNENIIKEYEKKDIIPIIFVDKLIENRNYKNVYIIDSINKEVKISHTDYNNYICNFDELIFNGKTIECYRIKDRIFKEYLQNHIDNKKRKHKNLLFNQEKILIEMKHQNKIDMFKSKYNHILGKEIILIDGYYKVDNNIRFKYLKNFEDNEDYLTTNFSNIITTLKNNTCIYIMIPKMKYSIRPYKRDMANILNILKKYGFENIKIYNPVK